MTFWMMVPFSIRTRRFLRVDETVLRFGFFSFLSEACVEFHRRFLRRRNKLFVLCFWGKEMTR